MEQNIFLQEFFKIIQYEYQPKKTIKHFSGTTRIDSWKSNEISEENIENIIKSENIFTPTFLDHRILPDKNLNGNCSMNNTYIPKKVINI